MEQLNIYGYARLSRDEDKENYESIKNQVNIIKEQVEKIRLDLAESGLRCQLTEIFIDDNVSGYTMDRPEFNRLKEKILSTKQDKAHIIIAKDSSRIGRHNAKTLLFYELLKEHGVRIILASDNYDSKMDNDDVIGIKTWFNEMYIKDISRKINQSIKSKQKNGGLIVKNHYGYQKDKNNKHQLVIDEEAAEVIRLIFRAYIEGKGYRRIADLLNEKSVPTPSQYHQRIHGGGFRVADKWSAVHVQRIISNDIYIGILRCGKTRKKKIKGASYTVDENEHIVYEDHHPGIISKEDFKLARQIALKRDHRKIRASKAGINLFSGYLFCGECGSYLVARKRSNRPMGYYCGSYHQFGSTICSSHHIVEQELIQIMIQRLKEILEQGIINIQDIDKRVVAHLGCKTNYDEIITKLVTKLDHKKQELKNYARQRAKNQIDEEMFKELVAEGKQGLERLEQQLAEAFEDRKKSQGYQKEIRAIDMVRVIIEGETLHRREVEQLLDRIIVKEVADGDQGKPSALELDVIWNFSLDPTGYHTQEDVKLAQDPLICT